MENEEHSIRERAIFRHYRSHIYRNMQLLHLVEEMKCPLCARIHAIKWKKRA